MRREEGQQQQRQQQQQQEEEGGMLMKEVRPRWGMVRTTWWASLGHRRVRAPELGDVPVGPSSSSR